MKDDKTSYSSIAHISALSYLEQRFDLQAQIPIHVLDNPFYYSINSTETFPLACEEETISLKRESLEIQIQKAKKSHRNVCHGMKEKVR